MAPKLNIVLSKGRLANITKTLRIGDILCGKVLKKIDDQRYTIYFQGQRVVAAYSGQLLVGSLIKTIVQTLNPQIILRFYESSELTWDIESALKHLRKKIQPVKTSLRFNPDLATICNDLKAAMDRLCALKKEQKLYAIAGGITSFLSRLALSGKIHKESLSRKIKKIFHTRFELDLEVILQWITQVEKLIRVQSGQEKEEFLSVLSSLRGKLFLLEYLLNAYPTE